MAAGKLHFKSDSGGITSVSREAGATNGELVLPVSGTVVSVAGVVTDNAIARYDSTTGKLQNSGVVIDDNNNVVIGVAPSPWIGKAVEVGYTGTALQSSGIGISRVLANTYQGSGGNFYYANSGVVASMYEQSSATHTWYKAPSGTAGNVITWTNTMTLDTSGQLTLATGINGLFRTQKDGNNYSYLRNYDVSDTTAIYANVIASTTKSAILANGTYQSATNVYGSTSDIKLKENIVDTSPKLNKLMKVQVRNFSYIGQEGKQIGVIAQEIEQIFPSVVFETKDTKQVEVTKERIIPVVEELKDDDGNVIQEAKPETIEKYIETETQETGEVTKNVKYSVLYMIAIKALQELNAKVEAMQLEINELRGI